MGLSVMAQSPKNKIKLTGTLVDADTKTPMEYATVSLLNRTDSSLVTGNITDAKGSFSIEAKAGNYLLNIEYVGYAPKMMDDIALSSKQPTVDLGIIPFQSETTNLEEVIVQGEKSTMELSLDKKIFNVGQDLGNAGRNAVDILGNIPSVMVGPEGDVSLRGSENVRILVDGRPSSLVSFKGAAGLRQLQGSMIEKVEVITNPSARYEAEGTAGIINIVLKKEQRQGLNGSFDFTTGYPNNHGIALNLNYRREKFNFFINYGIFYQSNPRKSAQYQEVYGEDTTAITRQTNESTYDSFSNNVRFGSDYFFNLNNILTASLTYRHIKGWRTADIEYRDYLFSTDNLTGITTRKQDETETEPKLEYALNYKKLFEREGHELNASINVLDNWEESDQDFTEAFFTPDYTPTDEPVSLQNSYNYETEKQFLLQVDYVHPFGDDGKFEAGLRSSFRDITNDYQVDEITDEGRIPIEGLDNSFVYDENIMAAYLIAGDKMNKFSYQLGLRVEYSDVRTELLETDEVNQRNYTNLFPSAHITYDLPAQNAIQLSYSRRIRRPTYFDLTPYFTFLDNRNFMTGNPDLEPEYTHALEIGHIKDMDKASITSSLYYRYTTGKIMRIRRVDEDGIARIKPENLATEDAYGLEFTANYDPFSWWKLDGNFNFFRAITDGENLDASFESDTYSWFARVTSKFTLWKTTDLQLRGHYEGPQQTPQGSRKANYYLDFSLSRDVFKEKGTLTLNVSDLFYTYQIRTITEGDTFYTSSTSQRISPLVYLTLNYRLNQNKGEQHNVFDE